MTIFLIAIGVCAVVVAVWCIRAFMDGRRLRGMRSPEAQRRIYDAYESEVRRRGGKRRYSELIETVSSRTDQSKHYPDGRLRIPQEARPELDPNYKGAK
jgi:hypothetical protein